MHVSIRSTTTKDALILSPPVDEARPTRLPVVAPSQLRVNASPTSSLDPLHVCLTHPRVPGCRRARPRRSTAEMTRAHAWPAARSHAYHAHRARPCLCLTASVPEAYLPASRAAHPWLGFPARTHARRRGRPATGCLPANHGLAAALTYVVACACSTYYRICCVAVASRPVPPNSLPIGTSEHTHCQLIHTSTNTVQLQDLSNSTALALSSSVAKGERKRKREKKKPNLIMIEHSR